MAAPSGRAGGCSQTENVQSGKCAESRAQSSSARAMVLLVMERAAAPDWARAKPMPAATPPAPVERLLVTSTARDGSLAGPDVELLGEVLQAGLPVIAAGGISSIDDLIAVRALGCEAAVAGTALLAGRFTLSEARRALAG